MPSKEGREDPLFLRDYRSNRHSYRGLRRYRFSCIVTLNAVRLGPIFGLPSIAPRAVARRGPSRSVRLRPDLLLRTRRQTEVPLDQPRLGPGLRLLAGAGHAGGGPGAGGHRTRRPVRRSAGGGRRDGAPDGGARDPGARRRADRAHGPSERLGDRAAGEEAAAAASRAHRLHQRDDLDPQLDGPVELVLVGEPEHPLRVADHRLQDLLAQRAQRREPELARLGDVPLADAGLAVDDALDDAVRPRPR